MPLHFIIVTILEFHRKKHYFINYCIIPHEYDIIKLSLFSPRGFDDLRIAQGHLEISQAMECFTIGPFTNMVLL